MKKKKMHREIRVGKHLFLKVKAKESSLKLGIFPKIARR
jgi:hypothetical protein